MALQDTGIFIASSLIADTPEKETDKENAEPTGDTPAGGGKGPRAGESGSRSARKSLLGRRRSSVGRRLSGFGGGGFDANADQSKLTSMYSSIIKLSSENKITRDKCWGLHLIDYMDRVILDEGGQMGGSKVNFQKASCTLDASVKIYSHRVDATHISSYSLLDNLNRSDNDNADKGAGAAVGSSERSARLGVHETLKKPEQLDQSATDRAFKMDPMFHKMSKIFDEAGSKGMLLNNLSVSDGCKVSFDSSESSAAATAPPSPEGAEDQPGRERVFRKPEDVEDGEESKDGETPAGEEVVERHPAAAEAAQGMTNIKDLRSTLFSLCGDLSALALCPQLEEFREQIAEIEEETHKDSGEAAPHAGRRGARGDDGGAAVSYDTDDSDGGGGGGGFDDVPGLDDASVDGGGDFGGGGDDEGHDLNVGGGGADDDDADPFQADNGGGFGGGGGTSFLVDGDGEFGAGLGSGGGAGSSESGGVGGVGMVVTPVTLEDRLCVDMKIVNDDYAFYDTGALAAAAATSSNNNWAGASHWKFVGVKKRPVRTKRGQGGGGMGPDGEPMVDEDGNELDAGGAVGGRKARGKRRPPAIDFDAPPVAQSALAPPPKPKSRGRRSQEPTLLSEDYVKRAFKAAGDGSSNYALPENARFKTKDLGELFLRKGAFTKRWAAGEAGEASEGARVDLQGFHDTNNGGGSDDDLLFADADDGYGGGDDFDDDDDDDDDGGVFQFGGGGFEAVGGDDNGGGGDGGGGIGAEVDADGVFVDNFEGQGLLAAGRRVEKISVNYAKKAKRVDVRRLKGDLWRKINTEFQSDAAVVEVDGGEGGGGAENRSSEEEVENKDVESKSPADGGDTRKEEAEDVVKPAPEVVDMTFSNIVCDVASKEEQTGVTVPFYFICLLHLANEKGLKLEGRDDLLDFSVASDPVKEGSY